jgi:sulfur carrier protein
MTIELNGSKVEIADGATVSVAIEHLDVSADERGIAVAVDGEVVPRTEWAVTALRERQSVEVVRAVQGG